MKDFPFFKEIGFKLVIIIIIIRETFRENKKPQNLVFWLEKKPENLFFNEKNLFKKIEKIIVSLSN